MLIDSEIDTPAALPPCEAQSSASTALIDWLSFSVVPPAGATLQWVNSVLIRLFRISPDDWKPTDRGWFGYTRRIDLGKYGLLAHGGERQRGTVHVELNAHGCARVNDWAAIREWGESARAHITRCDLAHDDFFGQVANIPQLLAWHREDGFTTGGRRPKARLIDDLESGEGKTLYVGKRKHGKVLRGYEKGKQLGRPTDPWFRIEVEIHNKGRVVPWEALTAPGKYFAGSYPCLAMFCAEQSRIATNKRALEITYEQMENWVGIAAGKALNVMLTVHQGDAVAMLNRVIRSGAPTRLVGFSADDLRNLEPQE